MIDFKVGSKVRYKWTHRMFGTITRPYNKRFLGTDQEQWMVLWENGAETPAYPENMELLP